MVDLYEVDGVPLKRLFVSAQSGQGVPMLRQMLAEEVLRTDSNPEPVSDPRFDLDNFGENEDDFS
jgi:GTP-binding protein HflX